MIHKFCIDDTYIVLDVNGGAVHKVDKLIFDVLDYYKTKSNNEIIELLKDKYNAEDIEEALFELKLLEEQQMLYTSDDYIENLQSLKVEPVIKAICLHVSHDCNLRCKYCFASYGHFGGDKGFITPEVGKKAVDFVVKNSGNRKNIEIDFFGGEPLLKFNVVKEIIEYAKSIEKACNKSFKFTITTNAILLNEEIKEYVNQNISNIVLSIDGRKNVNDNMRVRIDNSGTYDEIIPKIKDMADSRNQEKYYVRGTYTSKNLDFSNDVIHLSDLGFRQISIEPVVSEDEGLCLKEEHLPELYQQYELLAKEYLNRRNNEKWFNFFHFMVDLSQGPCVSKRLSGCGAGHEYVAITPQGDIYPCHQFVGNQDFKMGNVFDNNVDKQMQKMFKDSNVYSKESCKNCWARFYCSGGCHASSYNFNKDIKIPYKIGCELERKRVECALYIAIKEKELSENDINMQFEQYY